MLTLNKNTSYINNIVWRVLALPWASMKITIIVRFRIKKSGYNRTILKIKTIIKFAVSELIYIKMCL